MNRVSSNFTREELHCPCCLAYRMSPDFVFRLQRLRTYMDRPFIINSAYRCPDRNKAVGGAPASKHMEGIAVDISTEGWSSREKYDCLEDAFELGFNGIGISANFIHLDTRQGDCKLWVYS